jgi:uncharacterized protein involved in response to NO
MNVARRRVQRWRDAPLWASGFRPFYLLGALYAPLLALGSIGAALGWVDLAGAGIPLPLWHGHEMVFGFATAIVIGTVLTALPSWAGMPEPRGAALMLLAGLWLLGRCTFWAAPWLPRGVPALADLLLLPVLMAVLVPVWRVPQRRYRWLLVILLALTLAMRLTTSAWSVAMLPTVQWPRWRCAARSDLIVLYAVGRPADAGVHRQRPARGRGNRRRHPPQRWSSRHWQHCCCWRCANCCPQHQA